MANDDINIAGRCRVTGKPFATEEGLIQHIRNRWYSDWDGGQRKVARYGGLTSENKWWIDRLY